MKRFTLLTLEGLLLVFFLPHAFAEPVLKNPVPLNGSYISGGSNYLFSVDISSTNFNSSSAILTIGSQEVWPSKASKLSMKCYQINSSFWKCNTTVLISVAESGTKEFYYFEAADNDGSMAWLGNETYPLEVILDRDPPTIKPLFKNNSYVSVNKQLKFLIEDKHSGISQHQNWMYGNKSWNSTWFTLKKIDNQTFETEWDNLNLPNNSSWFIYVNSSDNVGNFNLTKIGLVRIDNEYPKITDVNLKNNEVLLGLVNFSINVTDKYSGIKEAYFVFQPTGIRGNFSCNGLHHALCKASFDTKKLPAGSYQLILYVSDLANNTISNSINVKITNIYPVIEVLSPKNNSWVHGNVPFKIIIQNCNNTKEAKIRFYSTGISIGPIPMKCLDNACEYSWETTGEREGDWTVEMLITNELGYTSKVKLFLKIDNTRPIMTAFPEKTLSGVSSVGLTATDENGLNSSSAWFSVDEINYTQKMDCNIFVGGKKIVCSGKIDTTKYPDGEYTFHFHVYDLAGNEQTQTETLTFDNSKKVPLPKQKVIVKKVPEYLNSSNTIETAREVIDKSLYIILIILVTIISGVAVYAISRKETQKRTIKIVWKKIDSEYDVVQAIKSYIYSILSTDDIEKMKENTKNILILLDKIPTKSFIEEKMSKLISFLKPEQREKIISKYSEKIKEFSGKSELLSKIREDLLKALAMNNVSEIKETIENVKKNYEKLEDLLGREKAVWEEFVNEFNRLIGGKK